MARKMLQENRDPTKLYPTGIKISLRTNLSSDYLSWTPNSDFPRVCFEKPTLDIYYTSCSNPDNSSATFSKSIECVKNFPQSYCTSYEHRLFCFSKFTERKSINPYVEGILGNWRVDSTYAYFGERKEKDALTDVDT
jgi:hypothetical protein